MGLENIGLEKNLVWVGAHSLRNFEIICAHVPVNAGPIIRLHLVTLVEALRASAYMIRQLFNLETFAVVLDLTQGRRRSIECRN